MNDTYLRRLNQLLQHYPTGAVHSVSIDKLEEVLATSRRNTSLILKHLADIGWVTWKPAVGRSKASQLVVLVSFSGALLEVIIQELSKGRFTLITRLLELYGDDTVLALASATLKQNQWNESNNHLLITRYPAVDTLDPLKTLRLAELQVIKSVYDTLLKQDVMGNLIPALVHFWKQEECRLILWLRPDVVAHNGQKLVAEDVVWSLQRLKNTSGPVQHLFECMVAVNAESDHRIVIELNAPNAFFPYTLAMSNSAILCRPQRNGVDPRKCVGTGPFSVGSWDDEKLTLIRHQHYYSSKALIEQITLSHSDEQVVRAMSFNQKNGATESSLISALSYLTFNPRSKCGVDADTLTQLYTYLAREKYQFDADNCVENLACDSRGAAGHHNAVAFVAPTLKGNIVLAEPIWTIPYLQTVADWLHDAIRRTGLELEVIELQAISEPHSVAHLADMLLIEEVVEQPKHYGLYEWLLVSTGLRFTFTEAEMEQHKQALAQAVSHPEPYCRLQQLEQQLYEQRRCLPLFVGREEVTCTQQVQGIQVNSTGYSDFYKLWIGD
ncbi:SgrR family transcriptional regulator [Vibrio fluvialis]